MPESVSANAKWQYEYIDHYRLDEKIINGFLSKKWGDYKYYVKVRDCHAPPCQCASTDLVQRMGDEFRFWVPRALDKVGFIQFLECSRFIMLTLLMCLRMRKMP